MFLRTFETACGLAFIGFPLELLSRGPSASRRVGLESLQHLAQRLLRFRLCFARLPFAFALLARTRVTPTESAAAWPALS